MGEQRGSVPCPCSTSRRWGSQDEGTLFNHIYMSAVVLVFPMVINHGVRDLLVIKPEMEPFVALRCLVVTLHICLYPKNIPGVDCGAASTRVLVPKRRKSLREQMPGTSLA